MAAVLSIYERRLGAARPHYLSALESGARRRATEIALELLYEGMPAETVLTGLVAQGQVEVGLAWQEARWSVSQEHRATAIADAVLQAVLQEAGQQAQFDAGGRGSPLGAVCEPAPERIVMACTEGEWHVLPGRLAGEILRLRGFEVSFIGPSVPAADLAGFLGQSPPPVAAVTCSMPLSLVGAFHTISALRSVGARIICGGRGFGPQGRWGLALGADVWASDFSSGAKSIQELAAGPRGYPRGPAADQQLAAEVERAANSIPWIVQSASEAAMERWPQLRDQDAWARATRDDLEFTLRAVMSAALVEDMTLVTDYVTWFESVLAHRKIPESLTAAAFSVLLDALPLQLSSCREAAKAGLAACSGPPPSVLPQLRR